MPANTTPIFGRAGNIEWAALTAANTAMDGTGTVATVFTADAANGSYLQKLVVRPKGTNVATVLRVFMNNGSDNSVAANNALIGEYTLPATTATATAALAGIEVPVNAVLPPGYKINVTLGTAVAAGYAISGWGGPY